MYITMDINHSQCTKRDSDTTVQFSSDKGHDGLNLGIRLFQIILKNKVSMIFRKVRSYTITGAKKFRYLYSSKTTLPLSHLSPELLATLLQSKIYRYKLK